jgi:hypothetical protein
MPLLSCKNARRDYLSPFGYGTFALPKAGVPPLTMLAKNGSRLTPIGPLGGTFPPGPAVALPPISRNRVAPISGARSKAVDAGIGLDILGSAIGALAGSTLGLKLAYKKASAVEFEFGDVFESSVDPNEVDKYLANTQIDSLAGPGLRDLLDDDEVYVMTGVLDANQISVKATASTGADLGLEVPVVQQLVGGSIKVSGTGQTSSLLTYSSADTPLAIGGKVLRILFNGSVYKTFELVKPTEFGVVAGAPETAAPSELIEI